MLMHTALRSIAAMAAFIMSANPTNAQRGLRNLSDETLDFGVDQGSMSVATASKIKPSDSASEWHPGWNIASGSNGGSTKSAKAKGGGNGSAKSAKSEGTGGWGEWSGSAKSAKSSSGANDDGPGFSLNGRFEAIDPDDGSNLTADIYCNGKECAVTYKDSQWLAPVCGAILEEGGAGIVSVKYDWDGKKICSSDFSPVVCLIDGTSEDDSGITDNCFSLNEDGSGSLVWDIGSSKYIFWRVSTNPTSSKGGASAKSRKVKASESEGSKATKPTWSGLTTTSTMATTITSSTTTTDCGGGKGCPCPNGDGDCSKGSEYICCIISIAQNGMCTNQDGSGTKEDVGACYFNLK